MFTSMFQATFLKEPLFEPRYLNMEYLFNKILQFFSWLREFFLNTPPLLLENSSQEPDWRLLFIIGSAVSLILALGALYVLYKIWGFKYEERKKYFQAEIASLETFDHTEHNIRWKKVTDLLNAQSESDWRLAILEADNILADLLKKMGYDGETIGESLKKIEPSDFLTLSAAWEAHKVRNRIAHEGAAFRLSHREAQRVVELYSRVFEEFHYI